MNFTGNTFDNPAPLDTTEDGSSVRKCLIIGNREAEQSHCTMTYYGPEKITVQLHRALILDLTHPKAAEIVAMLGHDVKEFLQ